MPPLSRRGNGEKAAGDMHENDIEMPVSRLDKETARDYLKDRYNEELKRFEHLENKCGRFLNFVSIVIAAITALARLNSASLFHPATAVSWIATFVFLCGSACALVAWGHVFSALKMSDSAVMPKSRAAAEYISEASSDDALVYIHESYVDTIEELGKQLAEKSRRLCLAYDELKISALCMIFVVIYAAIVEFTK